MKHILPILTLTTLAAAASAQTAVAAPAGLSYNRVTVSRAGQNNGLSAEALLGSSNVLATIAVGTAYDLHGVSQSGVSYSLGYVFKNVAFGVDATLSIGAGDAANHSTYSVTLRRSLSEVIQGLEARVVLAQNDGADASTNSAGAPQDANRASTDATFELQYNITKQYAVAYSLTDGGNKVHTVSFRYNF
jgi:hypothetical protein